MLKGSGWNASVTQDLLVPRSVESYPHPVRGTLLYGILWLMLWGGYNTGPWQVADPSFPASTWQLIHGARAFLPLLAGWFAGLMLLARGGLPGHVVFAPVGLLGFFTLIGVVSSAALSRDPLIALYGAGVYGSALVVVLAIASDTNALARLSRVSSLNWAVCIAIMLGLLVAMPLIGGQSLSPSQGHPLIFKAYGGGFTTNEILGMAGTRNTGFARFAAVAGLAALGKVWQAKRWSKLLWSLVLLVSLFSLAFSQARTEILGFLGGAFVLLGLRRSRRIVFLAGTVVFIVFLGFMGFFQAFWMYLTAGHFDPTLSGRTVTWEQGWALFKESPWLGFGFHADRLYLEGQHMHNALLHALVQTGLLGTIPYVAAFLVTWILVVRLYLTRSPKGVLPLPAEIPGVLAFFTIASITESTFAFFGAVWLFGVPLIAYVQALAWQHRTLKAEARLASATPVRFAWSRTSPRCAQR